MVILKTYQQRAYTSKAGYERIAEVLRESARLYNAALEEWRWAYRAGVSVSLYSQYRELTAIRAGDAFWGGYLQNPVSFIIFDCYCIIES